jgi:hypothetical protein
MNYTDHKNKLLRYKPNIFKNSHILRPGKLSGFKPDVSCNHPGNSFGKYSGKNNPYKSVNYFSTFFPDF